MKYKPFAIIEREGKKVLVSGVLEWPVLPDQPADGAPITIESLRQGYWVRDPERPSDGVGVVNNLAEEHCIPSGKGRGMTAVVLFGPRRPMICTPSKLVGRLVYAC